MLIAIFCVLSCQLLAWPVILWLAVRYLDRKQADIEARASELVRSWLASPAENQPSELAKVVSALGEVIGGSAARVIAASFGAGESQLARQANKASDLLEAQVNPIMALLTGNKRGKGAALARLGEVLNSWLNKGGPTTPSDNGAKPVQKTFSL